MRFVEGFVAGTLLANDPPPDEYREKTPKSRRVFGNKSLDWWCERTNAELEAACRAMDDEEYVVPNPVVYGLGEVMPKGTVCTLADGTPYRIPVGPWYDHVDKVWHPGTSGSCVPWVQGD